MDRLKRNLVANRVAEERGDIVQTILIIVIFVVIVVAVGSVIWNLVNSQADRLEDCLTNAAPVGGGQASENCQ